MNKEELRDSFKSDSVITLRKDREFTDVMALLRYQHGEATVGPPLFSQKLIWVFLWRHFADIVKSHNQVTLREII